MCELISHRGQENGRLKVTYNQFEDFGVARSQILRAILELEAVGIVRRTYRGRRMHGTDPGSPGEFRLTWRPVVNEAETLPATNEWRRFRTDEEAKEAIRKGLDKKSSLVRFPNRVGMENEPPEAEREAFCR